MNIKTTVFFALLLLGIQATILFLYGHPWICECGYVKLWEGSVLSSGNSQHISDWYSFSHIIHGFIFYLVMRIILPKSPIRTRFLFALAIECIWEMSENTPTVINHYRKQALALGYVGDSIINSICDSIFMIAGFWIAAKLRWWQTLIIAIALEVWVGYEIRDNLTLNVINFIYIFPSIKAWQAGFTG